MSADILLSISGKEDTEGGKHFGNDVTKVNSLLYITTYKRRDKTKGTSMTSYVNRILLNNSLNMTDTSLRNICLHTNTFTL